MIRPAEITALKHSPAKGLSAGQLGITQQMSVLLPSRESLEDLPFAFRYHYRCAGEPTCAGHKQTVLDWEIGQAYRAWRTRYPKETELIAKIKEKWLDDLAGPTKDTLLFVGNAHLHPDAFMVLGTFYPPVAPAPSLKRSRPPRPTQDVLF